MSGRYPHLPRCGLAQNSCWRLSKSTLSSLGTVGWSAKFIPCYWIGNHLLLTPPESALSLQDRFTQDKAECRRRTSWDLFRSGVNGKTFSKTKEKLCKAVVRNFGMKKTAGVQKLLECRYSCEVKRSHKRQKI